MRGVALRVAACAAGAVLVAATLVGMSHPQATVELMNKQQAAWWGEGHKDQRSGNWDQGWLHKFVRGGNRGRSARFQQQAARGGNKGEEMEQIHSLLDKAVGMMENLGGRKGSLQGTAARSAATENYLAKTAQPTRRAELPQCFSVNGVDAEKTRQQQRVSDASDNLGQSYPDWTKGVSIPGHGQDGEWRHDRGPPYVQRLTMFAGDGVSTKGNGDLVRRVLGLKMAFGKSCDLRSCDHAWTGNSYQPQTRKLANPSKSAGRTIANPTP